METVTSYEVLAYQDEHWIIAGMSDSREEAIRSAKELETSKHLKAVAILQDTVDILSGKTSAMVIFKGGREAATLDPLKKDDKKREYNGPKKQARKPDAPAVPAPDAANGNEPVKDPVKEKTKRSLPEFIYRVELLVLVIGIVGLGLIAVLLAYIASAS